MVTRHSDYKGCTIYRRDGWGYGLRWCAYWYKAGDYGHLYADTLAGLKRLISERVQK